MANQSYLIKVLSLSILFLFPAGLILLAIYFNPFAKYIFQADALYPVAWHLERSISGGQDYITPPANYFFPEWLSARLLLAMFSPLFSQWMMLFFQGLLFISLLFYTVENFESGAGKNRNRSKSMIAITGRKVWAILFLLLSFSVFRELHTIFLVSHHFAAYSFSLLFLFLSLSFWQRGLKRALFFIPLFLLLAFSDSLFLIFSVIPVIVTSILIGRPFSRIPLRLMYPAILIGLYFIFKGLFISLLPFTDISSHYTLQLYHQVLQADRSWEYLADGFIGYSGFFLLYLLCFLQTKPSGLYARPFLRLLLLAGVLNFLFFALISIFGVDVLLYRYLIPFYSAPFIVLSFSSFAVVKKSFECLTGKDGNRTLYLFRLIQIVKKAFAPGPILFLVAIAFLLTENIEKKHIANFSWKETEANYQCLVQELEDLPYGLADYWNSVPLMFFSEGRVLPNRVQPDLHIFYWMNSYSHYEVNHERTAYQWIIPERLDRTAIDELMGDPLYIESCDDDREIWFYHQDSFNSLKELHNEAIEVFKSVP